MCRTATYSPRNLRVVQMVILISALKQPTILSCSTRVTVSVWPGFILRCTEEPSNGRVSCVAKTETEWSPNSGHPTRWGRVEGVGPFYLTVLFDVRRDNRFVNAWDGHET